MLRILQNSPFMWMPSRPPSADAAACPVCRAHSSRTDKRSGNCKMCRRHPKPGSMRRISFHVHLRLTTNIATRANYDEDLHGSCCCRSRERGALEVKRCRVHAESIRAAERANRGHEGENCGLGHHLSCASAAVLPKQVPMLVLRFTGASAIQGHFSFP
jgi:hypothetical protein